MKSHNAATSVTKYYYCPVSPRLINLDPSDPFKGSFSDYVAKGTDVGIPVSSRNKHCVSFNEK